MLWPTNCTLRIRPSNPSSSARRACLSSPSKSDLQQRDILIVENAAIRARINALLKDQDWIAGCAPAFVLASLPLGLTVHRDRYTDATDEKVRAYDKRRNGIFPYR